MSADPEPSPRSAPLGAEPIEIGAEEPDRERWFVPFVVIPLGIALVVLAIVAFSNFLLGGWEPRSIDRLLDDVRTGGANARKQSAFTLAQQLAEQVEKLNRAVETGEGDPKALARLLLPRSDLARVERAYDLAKGDMETRKWLLACLGLVGDEESVSFLLEHLERPDEPDPESVLRLGILWALARIGSASALPAYDREVERLVAAPDPGIASILAGAYGNLRDPAATQGLLRLASFARSRSGGVAPPAPETEEGPASSAPPESVRWKPPLWSAALNLAKRHDIDPAAAREAVPVLMEALEDQFQDPFRSERERIFRGDSSSGIFQNATQAGDSYRESSVAQTLEALLLLRVEEAEPLVRRVAEQDKSLRVRSHALRALERLKD